RAPDYHLIPVGNAGNITAYWRGYREYHRAGRVTELPRMLGYQAAGAAPTYEDRVIEEPRTVATAIKIGNPASWGPALEAMKDSRGGIDIVTDEEILRAYRMLAREEGIFMEPASAATVAGLINSIKAGRFEAGSTLVLTLTGHGLRIRIPRSSPRRGRPPCRRKSTPSWRSSASEPAQAPARRRDQRRPARLSLPQRAPDGARPPAAGRPLGLDSDLDGAGAAPARG